MQEKINRKERERGGPLVHSGERKVCRTTHVWHTANNSDWIAIPKNCCKHRFGHILIPSASDTSASRPPINLLFHLSPLRRNCGFMASIVNCAKKSSCSNRSTTWNIPHDKHCAIGWYGCTWVGNNILALPRQISTHHLCCQRVMFKSILQGRRGWRGGGAVIVQQMTN